jgi:hypothetical protein
MPELQLINFLTIFQLLAGIGLLFFYDDILRKIVDRESRKRCLGIINELRYTFQIEFSASDTKLLYRLVDILLTDSQEPRYQEYFKNTVSFCGKLYFVFLLAVMFVASHESPCSPNMNYGFILIADILLVIAIVIAFAKRDNSYLKKYWSFFFPALIIGTVAILSLFIPLSIVNNLITIYLIFASILILVIAIVLYHIYDNYRSDRLQERFSELKKEADAYRYWAVKPVDSLRYINLPSSIKELFPYTADLNDAEKKANQFFSQEIHYFLNRHRTTHVLFVNPIKDLLVWANSKWERRTIVFYLSFLTFLLLYIVELIALGTLN